MNKLMDAFVNFIAIIVSKGGNWIIVIVAVINVVVYFLTQNAIKKADNIFNPKNDKVNGVSAAMQWSPKEISELKNMRKILVKLYVWYANFTAIFPLLGILGTVAALLTYTAENMMANFMTALTTTLFGVLFAIVFKVLDANLSAPVDNFIDTADYVVQEYERKEAQK